jgi:alkanesulfonate monooxygenase SsuD/methylene tetrahydromethanopterin reductase-like flavin-dependent oxidoreductase (luciferase family)
MTRLREYVTVVRQLLDGRTVDFAGETVVIRGFRLKAPPRLRVPVFVAALGPRACRLAGAVADGLIFFLKTPAGVTQAMAWAREGAHEAGRDPAALECVLTLPVILGADHLERARAHIAGYARVPDYARSLRLQGFEDEVDAIAAGWAEGSDQARQSVSPAMIPSLVLPPDPEAGQAALAVFGAAGVQTAVLLPIRPLEPDANALEHAETVLATFAPRLAAGARG